MDSQYKYQGEEIAFNIEIDRKDVAVNLDELAEIIVYVLTDGCKVIKLSKTEKEGYITLKRNSEYQYVGIIGSNETKLLAPGVINIEINLAYTTEYADSGKWNVIQRGVLGVLRKSLIKKES